MSYHAIVNMDDAIEIARIFRKENCILKRKRKGVWWLYSRDSILDMMYREIGVEPGTVISISIKAICEPGQMILIDTDKAKLPLQNRYKLDIEKDNTSFPMSDMFWQNRFGIK